MKSQYKIETRIQKLESGKKEENLDSRFMIHDSKRKPKVFVGLSGGVDSAVSAALLKNQGYDVTGVFIKAWTPSFANDGVGTRKYPCSWKEDRRSAMKAAAVLDIPFITLDLEKEYKRDVVDYMIREYKEGRTPNPDVMCNKEIKFGHFLKFALENGAEYVATGHYAETSPWPRKLGLPLPLSRGGDGGEVLLLEGKDKNKDQTYFLWTLTQEQLKHILFPVGHLQKEEVRKFAKQFGLPQATRKDSQGLCFLGKIDMKEFLKDYVGGQKGDVLNEKEEIIGEHDGAILYTIGERHGFTITKKSSDEVPLYVVAKDIKNNTITVSHKKITPHQKSQGEPLALTLKGVNWISGSKYTGRNLECRYRYRQQKIPCKMQANKKIVFQYPQEAVSPGQSLVIYDGEICLGGGIIG